MSLRDALSKARSNALRARRTCNTLLRGCRDLLQTTESSVEFAAYGVWGGKEQDPDSKEIPEFKRADDGLFQCQFSVLYREIKLGLRVGVGVYDEVIQVFVYRGSADETAKGSWDAEPITGELDWNLDAGVDEPIRICVESLTLSLVAAANQIGDWNLDGAERLDIFYEVNG